MCHPHPTASYCFVPWIFSFVLPSQLFFSSAQLVSLISQPQLPLFRAPHLTSVFFTLSSQLLLFLSSDFRHQVSVKVRTTYLPCLALPCLIHLVPFQFIHSLLLHPNLVLTLSHVMAFHPSAFEFGSFLSHVAWVLDRELLRTGEREREAPYFWPWKLLPNPSLVQLGKTIRGKA